MIDLSVPRAGGSRIGGIRFLNNSGGGSIGARLATPSVLNSARL